MSILQSFYQQVLHDSQLKQKDEYDCSLCGFSNRVDTAIDKNSIQLNSVSYKCKASKIQRTIMSKERLFTFVLDLSNYGEFSQKFLLYSIHAIRQLINQALREKKNIKVMLMAFDDGLQIFKIKNEIQRLVFWDDETAAGMTTYPFSSQQIGLIGECKENVEVILDALEEEINQRKFRSDTSSKKIIEAVEYALKYTKTQSGKIFVVSGLNHELEKFKVMRNYDSTVQDSFKHHYTIVKKECLSESMNTLLSTTQMSVSFFMHKTMYAVIFGNNFKNLMPFHIISKSTNGQLRHYLRHQTDHFFYEFNYLIHECLYEMKFETLLRVRPGVGLKIVGIFGNYRAWKGVPEQVELISCQSNRKYTFEFIVEGRINSPMTVVQFSVLSTDLRGNRFYRIITHKVDLSPETNTILPEINYQNVNLVYLRAILHNMDLTPHFRKLQLALQDRCRRHLHILREFHSESLSSSQAENNENIINQSYMKKARSYVIFTFMLMQHFLLNLHDKRDIFLDANIEARSKLMTYEDAMQIVWPIAYVVKEDGYEIAELKVENFEQGSVGVVIDRGDRVQIYLQKQELRNILRMTKDIKKAIQDCAQLENVAKVLQEIQEKKNFPHLDIIIGEQNYLLGFCIFSRKGTHSFENFIETLLEN